MVLSQSVLAISVAHYEEIKEFFKYEDKLTTPTKAETRSFRSEDDAFTLLIDDHEKVKNLFAEYAKIPEGDDNSDVKKVLVQQICQELIIHAQKGENKIFVKEKKAGMDTAALDKRICECKDDLIAEMEMDKEMDTVGSDEAENG